MAKRGRPRKYNKPLAEKICQLLSAGYPLTRICKLDEMPSIATVMKWLFESTDIKAEFTEMYAKAREAQAEVMADQIVEIADDSSQDELLGESGQVYENREFVNRSRLRVDARKWVAAKLLPRKYGDRVGVEHSGVDGGPIQHTVEVIFVEKNEPDDE